MRCISIEVTDSFTYLSEVDFGSKKPRLYRSLTVETPENVCEDGLLTDPELFARELRPQMEKAGFKPRQVVFSLSSNRIANRDVIIPKVKPNKILSLLTSNAADFFPVDVSNYCLGYDILEDTPGEGEEGMKLLVIAVPNDLIKSYYKFADALGLKIHAIDYIGNAIVSFIGPIMDEKPTMAVRIGDRSSVITIFKNRKAVLHRNIAYGADEALESLMDERKIGIMEAVSELRKANYFTEAGAEGYGGTDLRDSIDTLSNGIARVLDYYNSRNEEKIEEIFLTGFAADFKGLSEYIAETTHAEVKILHRFDGIEVTDGESVGNYVSTIGAAINPIDFTLSDIHGKKKKQSGEAIRLARRARILYAISAACLIIAASLAALTILEQRAAEAEGKSLEEEREELLPVVSAFNDYQETAGVYGEVRQMFELTKNRNEELHAFVEELEDKMPANAYVGSFTSDGQTATLSFTCSTKEEAGNLIENLRTFKSVLSVSVTGINEARDELTGNEMVSFAASLTYRSVGDDADTGGEDELSEEYFEEYEEESRDVDEFTPGEDGFSDEEGEEQ